MIRCGRNNAIAGPKAVLTCRGACLALVGSDREPGLHVVQTKRKPRNSYTSLGCYWVDMGIGLPGLFNRFLLTTWPACRISRSAWMVIIQTHNVEEPNAKGGCMCDATGRSY